MGEIGLKLEVLPWILFMLVVTSCVHEAGHAWTAWRLGDRSDHIRQRMTPWTFRHISLIFTIILPSAMLLFFGMMLGGAKPVMVRGDMPPSRMALIALAGPIGNAFCGVLSILVVAAMVHGGWVLPDIGLGFDRTYSYALHAVFLNFMLAALNLLPVPPFDGSRIVAMFLPEKLRRIYYSFTLPAIIAILVLFFVVYQVYPEEVQRLNREVLLRIHNTVLRVRDWVE